MGDNTSHALLSPSARHRWGACPGSVREEARYPEPPSNAAALDGTRSHALLEHCIKNGLTDPRSFVGTTFEYDHEGVKDSFPVDQARADRVNVAIEYIRSRPSYHTPIAEKRVFPDGLFGRADMHGTVDCQIPDKSVYEIIDYKDGMQPVEAKDNPQLEVYGLGVLAELPPENHPKVVRLTIIQPKLALKGMSVITSHDIKTADLLAKVPGIIAQAAATDDPNAPLIPGESQCKYCKAKGACPALAQKAMSEVGLMFNPVPSRDPEVVTIPNAQTTVMIDENEFATFTIEPAQQAANQDPTVMDNTQLGQILEAAPLMRQLIEGVEKEVQRRLEAGIPVPGFKLVNGPGRRKWALSEEEMEKKLAGMGMPKSAIYKTELISPAQAEKATWDKKGEPCKLSDKQIERMKKEYITTLAGKPTVAPESDPRPAVITNAAPMFSAVEPVSPVPAFLVPALEQEIRQTAEVLSDLTTDAPAASQTVIPDWLTIPAWLK